MRALTYIELFAGCGGLSLGLSSLGFERLLANELSPMAAESYAYNLLGTDLASNQFAKQELTERKVLWIKSAYSHTQMQSRLTENPIGEEDKPFSDLREDGGASVKGKLLVGDIRALNAHLEVTKAPLVEGVDIISGGPPCQSFSMAGMREYGNHRNRLPWEFAKFVDRHKPKLAILENVSGILHPFKEDGKQVHAWFEVAKAFAGIGYAPICLHVNAVNVGVAQNRPRYLMFAVRQDLVQEARTHLDEAESVLDMGESLLGASADLRFDPAEHGVIDLRGPSGVDAMKRLREIFAPVVQRVSVSEAIDDLSANGAEPSEYVKGLSRVFGDALDSAGTGTTGGPFNHGKRRHTGRVKARFRLYQVLAHENTPPSLVRRVRESVRIPKNGEPEELAGSVLRDLRDVAAAAGLPFIDEDGRELTTSFDIGQLVERLRTRKHSQRALRAERPAPAALSIPDDACHYRELRTLSVREMARIQSFPDDFVLRSIPTTGGARRKFQVPQYTQVGNAVPPKLGRAIGEFAELLLCGSKG